MSPGKVAAQVGHCAELYWINLFKENTINLYDTYNVPFGYEAHISLTNKIYDEYVNADYTKIICEAKNKKDLLKARDKAQELDLWEGLQYGLVYDNCYTELTPEEEDGTTLTAIWFAPMDDKLVKKFSKKYQLYK